MHSASARRLIPILPLAWLLIAPIAAPALPSFQPGGEPIVGEPVVTEGALRRGDSLGRALNSRGVDRRAIATIQRELGPHFDFRRSQPGHAFKLVQAPGGRVLEFRYRTSPTESLWLAAEGDAYRVERQDSALERRPARIAGVVSSTLYNAIKDLGETPQLAVDFTEIFAWDVDFSRNVQPGDEFRVLYERLFYRDPDGSERYLRPGRILAARYAGAAGTHTAVYFERGEGQGGYFAPDGSSVQRSFLRAPLSYSRISSRYTHSRRHPILKINRPHHGIDYAAPRGTPVWSVADGEVVYRGWAGGFGNLVKVRHRSGHVSYYAHLSRFGRNLRVGQKVHQKQVIGYVGSTGLATGPHVCFRIARDGKYVDPMRIPRPSGDGVPGPRRHEFYAARDQLLSQLGVEPLFATSEAL